MVVLADRQVLAVRELRLAAVVRAEALVVPAAPVVSPVAVRARSQAAVASQPVQAAGAGYRRSGFFFSP